MAGHRGVSTGGYPMQCEARAKLRAIQAERRAMDEMQASFSRGMANRGARGEPRPSLATPRTCRTPSGPMGRTPSSPLARTNFNWTAGRQPQTARAALTLPTSAPRCSTSSQPSSRASGGPKPISKPTWGAGTQRLQRESQAESARSAMAAQADTSQPPNSEASSLRSRLPRSTSYTSCAQPAHTELSTNGSGMLRTRPASFSAPVGAPEHFRGQAYDQRRPSSPHIEGDSMSDSGILSVEPGNEQNTERHTEHDLEPRPRPTSSPSGSERLRRFTQAQRTAYPRALEEIKKGRKSTCWMWFIIPTPPYVVNGVERGSSQNRKYALRNDDEARAYLAYEADGINLRNNYFEIMCAVREQLRTGKKAVSLMGSLDEPKLRSSASLFERITRDGCDEAIHAVVKEVIDLLRLQGSK